MRTAWIVKSNEKDIVEGDTFMLGAGVKCYTYLTWFLGMIHTKDQ